MKLKTLILIPLIALMSSCSALKSGADKLSGQSELISPSVLFATSVVFNAAVDAEDRAAKAEILSKIAEGIRVLPESKPTREEISALIVSYTNGKSHWVALAEAVSNYYEKYTAKIDPEDFENVSVVLREIARGLEAAAVQYKQ